MKKIFQSLYFRHFLFAFFLWAGLTCLIYSGFAGGHMLVAIEDRYFPHPIPDVRDDLGSLSVFFFICSIYSNPFKQIIKTDAVPQVNFFDITGLDPFYWEQATALVKKYGTEAQKIIELRKSDDILTENQKEDFRKTGLAVALILGTRNTALTDT